MKANSPRNAQSILHSDRNWAGRGLSLTLALAIALTTPGCKKTSISRDSDEGVNEGEFAEREAFEKEIRDLALKSDYEQLESRAETYRSSHARFANSVWKLNLFYAAFGALSVDLDDTQWLQFIQSVENWEKQKAGSVTAKIAVAEAYYGYAWKARGGGFADTVTDEGFRLMQERLTKAQRAMDEARLLPQKCPGWYGMALRLGLGKQMPREDYEHLFAEAVSMAPDYDRIYSHKAYYLLPRWYGRKGEWESFAAAMMQRSDIPDAKEIFAKIVLYLHQYRYFESEFSGSLQSSALLKESFLALQKHYPDSLQIKSVFCLAALKMYDYKQIREQLKLIGGKVDPDCWKSPATFQEVVEFAASDDASLERGYKDFRSRHP